MYLVTLQQQLLGSDPLILPNKKTHFSNAKEVGDWCHAFIRACADKGWLREESDDRMLDAFLMPQEALLEIRRSNLAPRVVLRNEKNPKEIVIMIELLEPTSPSNAAHRLTR